MTLKRFAALLLALLSIGFVAACGSDSNDQVEVAEGEGVAVECTPESLDTVKDGVLTIGTDSPAYPPYFEDDDPTNGQGFESAVAYAIAGELGFTDSQVEWTSVPFNASYAPGAKKFDFDINQVSIDADREKAVTFSTPYYTANQGVLVGPDSEVKEATSLEDLKELTIGVQIGTSSLDAVKDVIDPDSEPKVFDNSNDVVTALKQGQVDAIVVDLPQAVFLRDVQIEGSTVLGQFSAPGGDEWGVVMAKDSSLAPCVDQAVESLKESGRLGEITDQWMSESASAPNLD